ncbi:hypothetical protein ACSSNL_09310 [Thalassobius sp. S69A]|uniref:hypothetical protein n=1 Tax=unclassified Thalassovita TaxID=2619711 RepID=UPI003C7C6392
MKTLVLGTALGGMLSAPVALAQSSVNEDQLRFFATCAGRLSAQMEFQWMFDGAASEQTQKQRAGVVDILEAMIPNGRGHEVLSWRIRAKQAQAVLLSRGTFSPDPRQAQMAQRLALRQIGECRSALLS